MDAKKHSGVVGLFGETFVVAGLLPPSAGRELNDLLQARIKADYDLSATFTVDLVAEHVRKAEEFVSQAERLLREEGWLSD